MRVLSKSCGLLVQGLVMKDYLLKKLEENTIPEPNTGCLLWTAATHKFGYGQVRIKKKTYNIHRLLFHYFKHEIDKDTVIRHKCDTPQCCNINHLESGTQKDNVHDTVKRNRIKNQNSNKKFCKNGHEFTVENTRYDKNSRLCKICVNENQKNRYKTKPRIITEKYLEQQKKHREKNREKHKEYMKAYKLKKKLEKGNHGNSGKND